MYKYEIFTRSLRARKYRAAGYVLAANAREAALKAAVCNQNKFVRAIPAIVTI